MKKWRAKQPRKYTRFSHIKDRYGITKEQLDQHIKRQHNRCAGCNTEFLENIKMVIDHDHKTGKVRGLLCHHCNVAIGFAKDNREILYKLAAYLELDKTKTVVYVIGSLRNPKIVEVGNQLRAIGLEAIDNWIAAGPDADDRWREYHKARGGSYTDALQSREAEHVFFFDKAYIDLSDIVVLVYPAGKSAHLEFGYAIAQGKQGYILLDEEPARYDVMKQFATGVFFNEKDLLDELQRVLVSSDGVHDTP